MDTHKSANQSNGNGIDELSTKYSKLAFEYSKLRSQYGVVKKGLLEEKNKFEEISDILKMKETQIRKYESEIDSLNFRNFQLSKRVEILQEEADLKPKNSKNSSNNIIIDEELSHKISDNARLTTQLAEIDSVISSKVDHYESKIKELESLLKEKKSQEQSKSSQQTEMIGGYKIEKNNLLSHIKELEKEVKESKHQLQLYSSKSKFLSSKNICFEKESCPVSPKENQVLRVEILSQIAHQISEFVATSSDFHTSMNTFLREQTDGKDDSKHVLCSDFQLKSIETSFQLLIKGASLGKPLNLSAFSLSLQKYVETLISLTVYLSSSSNYTKNHDNKIHNSPCLSFQESLQSYVSLLQDVSRHLMAIETSPNDVSFLERIADSIDRLCTTSKELSESQFSLKKNEREKSTECVKGSLLSLSTSLLNLKNMFYKYLPKIRFLLSLSNDVDGIYSKIEGEEVNNSVLVSSLHEKYKMAEQQKEHWKLEFQLLEMKIHKIKGSETDDGNVFFPDDFEDFKNALKNKMNEMIAERCLSDSQAVTFYLESESLFQQMVEFNRQKDEAESLYQHCRKENEKMKEEINTTCINYEMQLSTMSEHLAAMNDKISRQTDEIAKLKYELSSKKK